MNPKSSMDVSFAASLIRSAMPVVFPRWASLRLAALGSSVALLLMMSAPAFAQQKRPLSLDDLARMREVRDPQCSPDGNWVAYVVSTVDSKDDKHASHV